MSFVIEEVDDFGFVRVCFHPPVIFPEGYFVYFFLCFAGEGVNRVSRDQLDYVVIITEGHRGPVSWVRNVIYVAYI